MCTGAEIGLIAGAGAGVFGDIQGSRAQAATLKRDAELTKLQSQFELQKLVRTKERVKGAQVVAATKGGVAISGSVLEVMQQSAADAELEALNIKFGAEAGFQARQFEAKQVKKAGKIRAGGRLLTAGATFLDR